MASNVQATTLLPNVSARANHWLQNKLEKLGKKNLQDLAPAEREALIEAAKAEAKKEQGKTVAIAVLASLAFLILLPALVVISFLAGSGLITIAPDSIVYPLLAGGLCAGGYGGFKLFQSIGRFYHKEVAERWNHAHNLEILSRSF